LGQQTRPGIENGEAARWACRMPASWRAHCVDGGGAGSGQPSASSERDREAAALATRRSYISMNRAVGRELGETAGTRLPRVTRQRETAKGAALNITALVAGEGKQSRRPASQRSEKRSVGWSFMPTAPRSQWSNCAGSAVSLFALPVSAGFGLRNGT